MFRCSESIRVLFRFAVCPTDQINILYAELGRNRFAYLPVETKLFNIKTGKRGIGLRVAGDELGEKKRGRMVGEQKRDQMGNSGTEPERSTFSSVLEIKEKQEESGIKKNVNSVSEMQLCKGKKKQNSIRGK